MLGIIRRQLISLEQLTRSRSMPELANNPLVERIIDTIDADKSGDVDFQEFIMALSIFIRGDKESKLRCM